MAEVTELRLGVIGGSEGNGHPYSWSAICNGYDGEAMAACPFPVIPRYLAARRFPEDALGGARVTHVWTQDPAESRRIAAAARIPHVAGDFRDLVGRVDAVLLARDDAENHPRFAAPFLAAGMPLYIDKPFAHRVADAAALLAGQRHEAQIFTCTALRYARELQLSAGDRAAIGPLVTVDACVPKSWEKYAIHVIEPMLSLAGLRAEEVTGKSVLCARGTRRLAFASRDGVLFSITAYGGAPSQIAISLKGEKSERRLEFSDAFSAFKSALEAFVRGVRSQAVQIPRAETLEAVRFVEMGLHE